MKRLYRKICFFLRGKRFSRAACVERDVQWIGRVSCTNSGPKENIRISGHCFIGGAFYALCGGKIRIGSNVYIGPGTVFQAKEEIVVHDNVIIANDVLLVDNNNHPTAPEDRLRMSACENYMTDELWTWKHAVSKPICVEENVWIGRNAVIAKGVTVGCGSIVAMGAVVTHDVPPCSIVAGNPAKVVKKLAQPEEDL